MSTFANVRRVMFAIALAVSCFALCAAPTFASADEVDLTAGTLVTDDQAAGAVDSDSSQAQEPAEAEVVKKPAAVSYRSYVKGKAQSWKKKNAVSGKANKSTKLSGIQIKLDKGGYEGGIEYQVFIRGKGWQDWVSAGKLAGSKSKKKVIEGVRIQLTGELAEHYDVVYRSYVPTLGWQRRMYNGEESGVPGGELSTGDYSYYSYYSSASLLPSSSKNKKALGISALRVSLVEKDKRSGWVPTSWWGGNWNWYKNGKMVTSKWITTKENLYDIKGKNRYWIDADGNVALSRIVDPKKNKADKKAGYAAYLKANGTPRVNEKIPYDGSYLLTNKKGRIITKTGWVVSKAYDGSKQRYYVKKKGSLGLVKTGFFKVKGAKYYGYPQYGYVMRNVDRWVGNGWYKASSKGKLKSTKHLRKKHIERYVKWAIKIANDDTHGYDQMYRSGPDYDCSGLVVAALDHAGFRTGGAGSTWNFKQTLTKVGFKWYTDFSKLKRGDILLANNSNLVHTEIYIGNNQTVGAVVNEFGGNTGGKTGDQTGNEIRVGNSLSWGYDGFLRYVE